MEEPITQPEKTDRAAAATSPSVDAWRFLAELVKTAVVVLVVAYVIRIFVLQPYIVEGLSMFPTFHDRDYLLVDKISYRVHSPHRGDVIVFKYPKDETYNYVKRIIGLPGDKIRIQDSKVYVIDSAHPDGVAISEPYVSPNNTTLPDSGSGQSEFTVPADSYFVLGDNRMGSSDSRNWGEVPKKDLIGRVLVLAYPFERAALAPHADYSNL